MNVPDTDVSQLLVRSSKSVRVSIDSDYEAVDLYSAEEVESRLTEMGLSPEPLIGRVEARITALDRYVAEHAAQSDLSPATLRRRLLLCAVMGSGPLLLAIIVAVARYCGAIESENAKRLSDVVIVGAVIVLILAFIAATQVTVESYVHQWLVRRSSEAENAALAAALRELGERDQSTGTKVRSHLQHYGQLSRFVSCLDTHSGAANGNV
jgi:hypothetical protein